MVTDDIPLPMPVPQVVTIEYFGCGKTRQEYSYEILDEKKREVSPLYGPRLIAERIALVADALITGSVASVRIDNLPKLHTDGDGVKSLLMGVLVEFNEEHSVMTFRRRSAFSITLEDVGGDGVAVNEERIRVSYDGNIREIGHWLTMIEGFYFPEHKRLPILFWPVGLYKGWQTFTIDDVDTQVAFERKTLENAFQRWGYRTVSDESDDDGIAPRTYYFESATDYAYARLAVI